MCRRPRHCAVVSCVGRCVAFNLLTLRLLFPHLQAVTRVAWSVAGPLVATGCVDGVVRLWDLRTAACVKQLHGHKQAVQDLTLSPDGSMVLSGADDAVARVFSLA